MQIDKWKCLKLKKHLLKIKFYNEDQKILFCAEILFYFKIFCT